MLFSAGMGIGLVFYGSSEPISHYLSPPTASKETEAALAEAMRSSFLHYGLHPWAVYGIVALALAYTQFRKNDLGLISRTLRPIFGNKVEGPFRYCCRCFSRFCYYYWGCSVTWCWRHAN